MPPIVAVAAAVVGAGSTAYGAYQSRKSNKAAEASQRRQQRQQEEDARIAKAENAVLRKDTGADLAFGTGLSDEVLKRGNRTKRTGTTAVTETKVGGL